jgi:diguanylate cyclase (GGDEF)-like protein
MALTRWWIPTTRAVSALGLALFAVAIVLAPPGGELEVWMDLWLYCGLMVTACVIAGSRALFIPRERLAWLAITLGLMSWTFGEIWYAAREPVTYPSIADYGYLGLYPFVYVGIVLLLRAQARAVGAALWFDGLMAALAAATLGAAILVELVLESTEGSLSTVVTNLAYPLGDLLLVSAVFGVFSLMGWRPGLRWLLLGLGMLSTALADSVYLFQVSAGTYVDGTWIDILWPAAMLLIASAAWTRRRRSAELEIEGRPLLVVPAACAFLAIGVFVYDHFQPVNVLAVALATATLLAVVARLGLTFRENRRLLELTRHEAITDALTGLGNRRKLLTDLERRLEDEDAMPTLLMIFDLDGFKGYNDSFGHPAGDALLARLGGKLASVPGSEGAAYRLGGDEFCLIAPAVDGETARLIDRSCEALTEHGEGFEIGTSFGAVVLPDEATDSRDALQLADERLYAQKHMRRAETDRTVHALLNALSDHEPELAGHLEGVAALAVDIGEKLGLRRDELFELARAARLHDVGKLAVPDSILRKPGPLDEREWEFMRQHTVVGERILRASPTLRDVASIVRSTHENWDGTGYPDRLAREEIPLAARIIFACDAYDAMTGTRRYGPTLTHEEALEEIERSAGTQFDPTVARVLVAHVRDRLEAERAA